MKIKLLLFVIICSTLSANQMMMQPQEYQLKEETNGNIGLEDPFNDGVELLDFELVNPDEQIDAASLNPPLWVVYLNKLTTPLFALYNKIHKWFRVHSSARELKVR